MGIPLLLLHVFLCFYVTGSHAEDCTQAILSKRGEISLPPGGPLVLTCVIQHCGVAWEGSWMWKNSSSKLLEAVESAKISLKDMSRNQTQLMLRLESISQMDEGLYGCRATWGDSGNDQGNLVHVTVLKEEQLRRNPWHRVVVCFSAFLCLPIILMLAHCLRCNKSTQPKALLHDDEVVYANVSQDALSSQHYSCRVPEQITIYSTVRFS